ncbi:hypothetical protein D3C87_2207580 [compost metagenome]
MQALVDGVCTELGATTRPSVQAEGESAVRVAVDGGAPALADRLRQVLAPLPIQVQVVLSAPGA